jgi:hypothetical protein
MRDPKSHEAAPEQGLATNVTPLAGRIATPREAPVTGQELAEYRKLRPRLLAMLEGWERLVSPGGCPAARSVLNLDK